MGFRRKTLIAGNWKLNKTIKEALDLVTRLKRNLSEIENVDILVCPPATALSDVADALEGSHIALGAQNIYHKESGAFTGEVSATLIKEAGARYVVVGHSERRQYFHETDKSVNLKTKAALSQGLKPIVCVGETLEEREADKTFEVIETQIQGVFADFKKSEMENVIVAYEPVWAIGTGKVATPEQAQEVHSFIRVEIAKLLGEDVAGATRILYGGSVKPDNIANLLTQTDIDGGLVGGASLDADSFTGIVKNAAAVAVPTN